jgi:hypothetical protein
MAAWGDDGGSRGQLVRSIRAVEFRTFGRGPTVPTEKAILRSGVMFGIAATFEMLSSRGLFGIAVLGVGATQDAQLGERSARKADRLTPSGA